MENQTKNGSKIFLNSQNKSVNNITNDNYKSKIIYTNQGWGITEAVKPLKNNKNTKSIDKSFVSISKDSRNILKSKIKPAIKINKNLELKIKGNQKIVKLGSNHGVTSNGKINPLAKNSKAYINTNKNSDDDFLNDFE